MKSECHPKEPELSGDGRSTIQQDIKGLLRKAMQIRNQPQNESSSRIEAEPVCSVRLGAGPKRKSEIVTMRDL